MAVRTKEGVVPEAPLTTLTGQNMAFADSFMECGTLRCSKCNNSPEPGAPILDVAKFVQQLLPVIFGRASGPRPSGRKDTRLSMKGHHFQPGVVGKRSRSREFHEGLCLFCCISLQGITVLIYVWSTGKGIQGQNVVPSRRQQVLKLRDFTRIARGEYECYITDLCIFQNESNRELLCL